MTLQLLTDAQRAYLKAVRSRAWVRPFTLLQTEVVAAEEYYDSATPDAATTYILSGDYAWFGQIDYQGQAAGQSEEGLLRLACDVDHYPKFLHSGAQLVVDGYTCAIRSMTPLYDSGECLIIARRAS